MSELKLGWRRLQFNEMVTSVGATRKARGWSAAEAGVDRYVSLEHLDPNSPTIRRWGSPEDVGENSDLRPFEAGDVILARRGIEQRKVGFATFNGVASGHALVFRARPGVVLPEFLPYFLLSDAFMACVEQFSAGSLSKTVNLSSLLRLEFALPPLEEQERIASRCVAENNVYETMRSAIEAAHQARNSLIAHLYSKGARDEPRIDTPLGRLPCSWSVLALGERYSIQLGKMVSRSVQRGGIETPYLRNANIQWGRLKLDDMAIMRFTTEERAKFSLRHGDILACEGGHVGKAAIWREEILGASYQKALHRIRALKGDNPEYMLYCMYYFSITGRFAAETGVTTIPHLPAERLRAMHFPFPTVEEQNDIVASIASFDSDSAKLRSRAAFANIRATSVIEDYLR